MMWWEGVEILADNGASADLGAWQTWGLHEVPHLHGSPTSYYIGLTKMVMVLAINGIDKNKFLVLAWYVETDLINT